VVVLPDWVRLRLAAWGSGGEAPDGFALSVVQLYPLFECHASQREHLVEQGVPFSGY